jgi:dipeptidyl aminopeptidase/acylaminoacyl peptidase
LIAAPVASAPQSVPSDAAPTKAFCQRSWPVAAMCLIGAVLAALSGVHGDLVVEGVPPVPSALMRRLEPYHHFRRAAFHGWHPGRLEMLVASGGRIYQIPAPGKRGRRLIYTRQKINAASYPPAGGNSLVLSRDWDGDEQYHLFRYDMGTRNATLLTSPETPVATWRWSHGGGRIACTSLPGNREWVELFLLDPFKHRRRRRLARLPGEYWGVTDWSPDDEQLLLREWRSPQESRLWRFDLAAGRRTLLAPRSGPRPVAYGGGSFSADGAGIFVTTDRDSNWSQLIYLDLGTGQHQVLTGHIAADVDRFALSEDGRTIAFTTNENGFSMLRFLDAETRKELPGTLSTQGVIENLDWHSDSRHLGFSFESPRDAPDAYSMDIETGEIQRWTYSHHRTLPEAQFSEPTLIRWPSFDGRSITGWLYRPPARFRGRRPVIIDIHGGPTSQSRPGYLAEDNYFLNERGAALLYPNVRGSQGYGKSFLALDDGLRRQDAVKDIGALLDWIPTRPDLDPSRVMVSGGSYGGYLALAVAATYNNRIRCARAKSAPSSLLTLLQAAAVSGRGWRRHEYGDERDLLVRACLEQTAPVHNAWRIKNPVLLAHGGNDPRVPVSESGQMAAALRRQGVPVWYLLAPNEGHGFYRHQAYDAEFETTVLFVERYLLP